MKITDLGYLAEIRICPIHNSLQEAATAEIQPTAPQVTTLSLQPGSFGTRRLSSANRGRIQLRHNLGDVADLVLRRLVPTAAAAVPAHGQGLAVDVGRQVDQLGRQFVGGGRFGAPRSVLPQPVADGGLDQVLEQPDQLAAPERQVHPGGALGRRPGALGMVDLELEPQEIEDTGGGGRVTLVPGQEDRGYGLLSQLTHALPTQVNTLN